MQKKLIKGINMPNLKTLAIALCLISLNIGLSAQDVKSENSLPNRMMPRNGNGMMPMGGMMPHGGGMMPFGGALNQFGVEFAKEMPQDENVVVKSKSDTLYNYYVENVKFGKPAKIVFSDNSAEVTNLPEGVKIEADGAYLTITSGMDAPLACNILICLHIFTICRYLKL